MKLRAPAYPLINVDPYFTVWSMADRLHDGPVKHWTGSDNTLIGVCSVDGEDVAEAPLYAAYSVAKSNKKESIMGKLISLLKK